MFVETLQSKTILNKATMETAKAKVASDLPRFDVKKLMEMPLLQSLYAATLRVYVTIMFLRTVQQETQLGGWTIPKGKKVMIYSHSEHMNETLWNPSPSVNSRHVSEFWAERFLSFSEPIKG